MEPKLFIKKLGPGYSGKVSELSYFDLTWDQWEKFAKMTRGLNYGCNFNTNGKTCSQGKYYGNIKGMCCCNCCLSHVGYLKVIPNNKEIIKEIASLFDESYGFWRKEKGCVLPIKYRSDTCISYRCYEAREQRNKANENPSFGLGSDVFEQMVLYFLETLRVSKLSNTQVRTIIKELIK